MSDGSGLTIEAVNQIQEDMNPIGDVGSDGKVLDEQAIADAKAAEDAAKLAEAKAVEDAKAKEEADAKAKEDADKKAKESSEEIDPIREVKEENRLLKENLQKVTSDYQALTKKMIDKGVISEEELKADKDIADANLKAFNERQAKLTEIVAIMEVNPTYQDVRTVCTQANLDDVVDAFARYYVKENGGNLQDVAVKMEQEIWQEPNPYKKIYELVKTYHPKYKDAEKKVDEKTEAEKAKEAEEAAKKIAADADKGKEKKVVEVTPSAANIGAGGSGAGSSGWTAAKIDALPEDELHTVPKDIYEKYLLGQIN
jgi:membrane protein involved in colicin uptake